MNDAIICHISSVQDRLLDACEISALMLTDAGNSPSSLGEALESIFKQTVRPGNLVLVIKGPIGSDSETVIAKYENDPRIQAFDIVRISDKNSNDAMNIGLGACKGAWILRVDSTGRSRPDRYRVHLDYIRNHPDIDLFSSWCEYISERRNNLNITASAIEHDAVVKALPWRNVIVPEANLIRTSTLRQIAGYRGISGKRADYDLYVRLALAGARFRVIPAALISLPANRCYWEWSDVADEIRHRLFCLRSGFINIPQFLIVTSVCTLLLVVKAGLSRVKALLNRARGIYLVERCQAAEATQFVDVQRHQG